MDAKQLMLKTAADALVREISERIPDQYFDVGVPTIDNALRYIDMREQEIIDIKELVAALRLSQDRQCPMCGKRYTM